METTSIQTFKARANGRIENNPSVIFALNTERADEREYAEKLLNKPLKPVTGCYKGTQEKAYVVEIEKGSDFNRVCDLCRWHKQESVLFINTDRSASLYFLNISTSQDLGNFVPVSPGEAIKSDAWTLDGSQFYICK